MATLKDRATGFEDRRAIEDFLIREVRLLDERRFDEWRELFADDGYYWVPLRPGQSSPDAESSLFYDDKDLMRARLDRLKRPCIDAQASTHRTCHVIGNITVDEVDAERGECTVRSTMIMADYRARAQRVFAGNVRHRLRRCGNDFQIVYKRVDLVNSDDAFDLIVVPF